MASRIWIPEHGDAGLVVPAEGIMERQERPRGPVVPQEGSLEPQAVTDTSEPASVPAWPTGARERRQLCLALRRAQRRQRRSQVRADNRLLYWAHLSGRGPRPPLQAVHAPGRYLSEFWWDEERRRWSSLPPTPELAQAA
jgi:hypothetical protein